MKYIKNSSAFFWTNHARAKMRFYGLSEQRVKRVIHTPKRVEEGIASNTVAMLQAAGSEKHPYEIWVMVQTAKRESRNANRVMKIISAWRYPGITKPGEPLPEGILREMGEIDH